MPNFAPALAHILPQQAEVNLEGDWNAHADLLREPLSRVELEAALGACREKALELELRLKNAEERMHLQARITPPNGMLCSVWWFAGKGCLWCNVW